MLRLDAQIVMDFLISKIGKEIVVWPLKHTEDVSTYTGRLFWVVPFSFFCFCLVTLVGSIRVSDDKDAQGLAVEGAC